MWAVYILITDTIAPYIIDHTHGFTDEWVNIFIGKRFL
jgi:hypothetical protein